MALSRHHMATIQPMSVQEIAAQAQAFEFGNNRSLKNWLRSAQMLLTEANMCEHDGNLQMAYLYLYRHAELILGKLPQHPEYKDPQYRTELLQAQKTVQKNLVKLEQWKPRINQQHQRYVKAMERRNAELQRVTQQGRRESMESADGHFDDDTAEHLNAREHRDLAVDIAHRTLRRRVEARQLATGEGSDSLDRNDSGGKEHGLGNVSESIRRAGEHLFHNSQHYAAESQLGPLAHESRRYHYPEVPHGSATVARKTPSPPRVPSPPSWREQPVLPAEKSYDLYERDAQPPPVPSKLDHIDQKLAPPRAQSPLRSRYTFKPATFTESGAPLRTVMLPPDLRAHFLNVADRNTQRNLETCGILCGTVIANALFISHLIIPDQVSTSDTCDTTEDGDNALFDYCDAHSLLVCGWIHTHPSQSCFLSSRDLHTSSGYQVMLPEAIAIVCAPRHNPDWGIFRLTDPPGLGSILDCRQKGAFHPHAETHLYTDALRPGHVVEARGLKFETVDLRRR